MQRWQSPEPPPHGAWSQPALVQVRRALQQAVRACSTGLSDPAARQPVQQPDIPATQLSLPATEQLSGSSTAGAEVSVLQEGQHLALQPAQPPACSPSQPSVATVVQQAGGSAAPGRLAGLQVSQQAARQPAALPACPCAQLTGPPAEQQAGGSTEGARITDPASQPADAADAAPCAGGAHAAHGVHSVQPLSPAAVLVLFSGGVDSTLLAALAHAQLPAQLPIDLAGVCFDNGRSPDRLAALDALQARRGPQPRVWCQQPCLGSSHGRGQRLL